jgi:uncharacterized membrane protein HdeD (DUF308 family)
MSNQVSQADIDARLADARRFVTENRGWFIALGIVLLIAGTAAILFPFLSTIAAKLALGWILLLAGVVNIVHAFGTSGWRGFFWNLLVGVLFALAGAYLAFFPLTGILTLTILLAALFIAEGVLEIVLAFHVRPQSGWGWVLLSGVIAVAVGVMIALELPTSAIWAIGVLTGINLIASGWSFIGIAMASDRAPPESALRGA